MARDERRRSHRVRACAAGLMAALVATAAMAAVATAAAAPAAGAPARAAQLDPLGDPGDPGDPGEPSESPTPAPTDPPESPSPEPSESEASPSPTPSEPPRTEPPPSTTPPVRPSTIRPPGQPGPAVPGQPRLGAYVTTGDIRLGTAYWHTRSTTTELRVDVANTGQAAARFALLYTLPDGVTDAGTAGCAPAGGQSYRCSAWTARAGAGWSMRIKVRVDGDAWERMPLMGSVQVTASAPGLGEVHDNQGFAVLFPPGPPTAGISLVATEVNFPSADQAATLQVQLRNTGSATASGEIEVVLPGGVSVEGPVDDCAPVAGRTRCLLGRIGPGKIRQVTLPLIATIEAQRAAPLSGAVFGTLTAHGKPKRVQMSFLITAVESAGTAAPAPPDAASGRPVGAFAPVAATERGMTGVQKTALALVVVSVMLVVLALVLAVTSLRRRIEDDRAPGAGDTVIGTDP
jgi:hypothetical protein